MDDKPLWHIPIKPCPAPRMVASDRWKNRPCVQRYREFRDSINQFIQSRDIRYSDLPERITIIFFIPFPKSKSKKWKAQMAGEGHRAKPDSDNLAKAFLDAWFRDADTDDSHIWDVRAIKIWADEPAIEVYPSGKLSIETTK